MSTIFCIFVVIKQNTIDYEKILKITTCRSSRSQLQHLCTMAQTERATYDKSRLPANIETCPPNRNQVHLSRIRHRHRRLVARRLRRKIKPRYITIIRLRNPIVGGCFYYDFIKIKHFLYLINKYICIVAENQLILHPFLRNCSHKVLISK